MQGEFKPEYAIDLSGEDMTLLGEVLGGEAPTLTGNQTIAIDGDKLVVVDDGKIIGDPITLDAAAQGELSDLQARADLQGELKTEVLMDLGGEDISTITTALGGEAPTLTGTDRITFSDGKLIVVDDQNRIVGDPIILDDTMKTNLDSIITKHDTALDLAGIEKPVHQHVSPSGSPSKLKFVLGQDKGGNDVKTVFFGGSKDLDIKGNDADNFIVGNNGHNTILGGLGNDVLLGYGGDDVIKGGSGNDFADGMDGQDRVYGQRGDDTLIATGHIDGESDSTASDLLAGGSGSDTLIDAANKLDDGEGNIGRTDLLGGSGEDTFAIGLMQHDLTFGEGAPVDTWDLAERVVNTHIADLTTSDDLDFIDLKEEATVAGATVLEVMDMDGEGEGVGTRISMNEDVAEIDLTGGKAEGVSIEHDDIIPLNPITGLAEFGEGSTITEEIREILINHAGIDPADATIAVDELVTADHLTQMNEDAPVLDLSGTIGISHATEETIMAALTPNSVSSMDTTFGSANSGGAMDHYGVTDDLVWIDFT